MKRLAIAAMLVAGICAVCALPACAQRGGGHGGSAGHSAGGFHGGGGFHSAPSVRAHTGPTRSPGFGVRSRAPMQSYRRSVPNNAIARSAYPDHGRHRRPYVSPYHTRYPYLLATPYGWIGSDYLGYPDDSDASAAPADNAGPYDAQLPEPDQLAGNPPYMPQMQSLSPPPVPLTQDAVTLVYKDGRPAEQIHNFVLTPTTLYVQDQQGRSIRVDQLDLEATAKANQEAGVSFQLPDASR